MRWKRYFASSVVDVGQEILVGDLFKYLRRQKECGSISECFHECIVFYSCVEDNKFKV
jgi:hypothetical protein